MKRLLLGIPLAAALVMLTGCDYSAPNANGPQAAAVGEYKAGEDNPEYGALRQIGQRVKLTAIVRDYVPDALQVAKSGDRPLYHPGTVIQIITPGKFFGKELIVHHPNERAPESVWRDSNAQMTIEVDENQLRSNPSILYEQELEVLNIEKSLDGREVNVTGV